MIKLTFLIIVLYWFFFRPKGEKGISLYITICASLIFMTMGLRSEAIFGDTFGYVYNYKHICELSVKDVLLLWEKDRFFWLVSYCISFITKGNYTIWLLLISLLLIIPLAKLIRKYSIQPMYSFLLLIYLGLLFFFMAGLRQTIALSFIIIGGLVLLDQNRTKRNKIVLYTICTILAWLFHGTAWVAILALLFINRPINRKSLFIYLCVLVICFMSGQVLMSNTITYIGQYDERYLGYGEDMNGATITYFLQQLVLVGPSLFFLKNRYADPTISFFLHLSVIGLILVSLSPVVAEMFRLSYYFSWANIILFTYTIRELRRINNYLPILFFALFIFFILFVVKLNEYYFFFEDVSHITTQFDTSEYLL